MNLNEHQQYILNQLEIPLWILRNSELTAIVDENTTVASKGSLADILSWEVKAENGDKPSICWLIAKGGRIPDTQVIKNFITALDLTCPDWLILKSDSEAQTPIVTLPQPLLNSRSEQLVLIQLSSQSVEPEIIHVENRAVLVCKVEDFEQIDGKRKLWACVQTIIK